MAGACICGWPRPKGIISSAVEGRESSGQVTTTFLGGGDGLIVTGFNPEFLVDALETIDGNEVLLEVKQNMPTTNSKVSHMLLRGAQNQPLGGA